MNKKLVQRAEYLSALVEWRDKQFIKVVTGVRRSGKSSLFSLYIDRLKETGVKDNNIVVINLEDIANSHLLTAEALHEFVCSHLAKTGKTYVFIDEVQQCSGFEKAIDSLYLKDNVDLYITGSNANLLSGELATLLSGRYIEIKMLPLSFSEYLQFSEFGYPMFTSPGFTFPISFPISISEQGSPLSKTEIFANYLRYGGFPEVSALENESQINTYLDSVFNTIVVKDIAKRKGINDITLLESIVRFLASSVGTAISIKKISDTLGSAGRKTSVNTIEEYVHALTESFIFYKADRFDIKGKQHLKTQNKYYIVDTGLRNYMLATSSPDIGHILENVVYLELRRRGYKVNIGKVGDKEIDFVTSDGIEGMGYYQVAATVLDESTLARELEPLNKIKDHFPKYILTMDDIGKDSFHNGIRQLNIIDWLTDQC